MPDTSIKHFVQVDSTNTVAMQMAVEGVPSFTVVVAESQTHGRGRLSRHWFSQPGTGLYFSVVLRPRLAVSETPKITLAAGVAICRTLEKECGLRPAIKWPNDILLGGRKVCGILAESFLVGGDDQQLSPVVLGVGLNVLTPRADFPVDLRESATSLLAETGISFSTEMLLAATLHELGTLLCKLERDGFGSIIEAWRKRDAMRGVSLSWLTSGQEVVAGTGVGLDDNGLYHIRDQQGRIHEVVSGDINWSQTG